MGIIAAAANAIKGTLKDQYKEFMYCDSMPMDVLVRKGQNKRLDGSTNRGNDNIITDGSRLVVSDSQCMIIVEDGKIIDFCAEPGEYIYNTGTSPSMLTGGMKELKDGFMKSIGTAMDRFKAGGQQDHDQRVYYVNMKELMGNKIGAGDIPFRDSEFNFTIKLRCFGEYSYKITNPIMFYTNVCGNIGYEFTRDQIDSQFKSEIQNNLQYALGKIGLKGIPYDQLTLFTKELAQALNSEMTTEWVEKRGISVVSFALASVTPDADSAKKIEEFQSTRVYTDPRMLAASYIQSKGAALEKAASNKAGAMTGFMGMGFAQQAGGNGGFDEAQLFNSLTQNPQQEQKLKEESAPVQSKPQTSQPSQTWTCECGTENTGKFCMECGKTAPVPVKAANTWICQCGTENTGKFCGECGAKKPLDSKCETCGYEADKPFKFCPECGAENKI
ncbi:SPFH domain-containing protein [Clostridium paridis]|uniref:SPFH domain-containing protein n=1 Tax=Clostridium paridis TaxID=2803863 RepID=A0A937K428_9CLOT|nr:SPFH domain-containing protein [Clostridium paridis]MBL4930720.1 SPFH domain-containing protein [Clostridium paridis]